MKNFRFKKYLLSFFVIYIIVSVIFIYTLPMNFCRFISWLGTYEERNLISMER